MSDFSAALLANCQVVRPPLLVDPGAYLPASIQAILKVANGLITRGGLFRVFGTQSGPGLPSLEQWNSSDWKRGYQQLAENFLIVAEDIFGNQYGYQNGQLCKFYCEGGSLEVVPDGINRLLAELIQPGQAGLIDLELVEAARQLGLQPQPGEHLAFKLPLVVGGSYEAANLGVESVELHLGTLCQMSVQVAGLS